MSAHGHGPRASRCADALPHRSAVGDVLFVAVAFLGSFSFWPALLALGALFDTLDAEFGWSRSQVTTAQLVFTIVSVAAAPLIGPLMDRHGVRPLLLTGLAAVPLTLVMVAFTDGSYARWVAVWVVASLAGQLVAPPVWSAGVARRFSRKRGLALGLAACGFATATAAVPLLLVRGIGLAAWRDFYLGMAAFLIVVLLPLTFLIYHERRLAPEEVTPRAKEAADAKLGGGFKGEVLRSLRFWQLASAIFLVSFMVGGMMVHLQPLFRAEGFSAAAAASVYSFYGVGGIVGRIGGGWLLDRFHAGPLPALPMCVFPVVACAAVLLAAGPSFALFAAVALLIGIAAGVEVDVVPYLVRRYFPERYFGRSYISLAAVFVAGAGASPFLVSVIYDRTGSYGLFLGASVLAGIVATVLLIGLGRYPSQLPDK